MLGQVATPRQMVGGHQFQCLGANNLLSIQRATIEQHPAKAMIIADSRGKAATARFKLIPSRPRPFWTSRINQFLYVYWIKCIAIGDPRRFVRRHIKIGIHHAQRFKDIFSKKSIANRTDATLAGGSSPCEINVACDEGKGWEKEASSVALILTRHPTKVNGVYYGLGTGYL